MLRFLDAGDWYLMLQDLRRMVTETTLKPRVTLGLPMSKSNPELGRGKWIEKEVQDFLYSEGENPFEEDYPLQTW